jgi:uncharacterized membrane protein
VTEREWALLFHLAGVVLLFSGLILAAAALAAARRREVAGEIAALLGLTRFGVVLVAAGALLLVGTGLWLVEIWDGAYSLGNGWIAASLGLLALSFVLGAIGGQKPKQARQLAEGGGGADLKRLLDDRRPDAFNYAAALAVIAALVLMVWKPGS